MRNLLFETYFYRRWYSVRRTDKMAFIEYLHILHTLLVSLVLKVMREIKSVINVFIVQLWIEIFFINNIGPQTYFKSLQEHRINFRFKEL